MCVEDGNYGAAIDGYTRALQRNPFNTRALNDQSNSTYFVRGEVYRSKSDFRSALADFQKALALTPADDPGRTNMLSAIESVKR